MEDNIEKYLLGKIDKADLSRDQLNQLEELDKLDDMMFNKISVTPKEDLSTRIISTYNRKSRTATSDKWMKGWLLGMGIICVLLILGAPLFSMESNQIIDTAVGTLKNATSLIFTETVLYLFGFVNCVTLLFILDKLLLKKLKLQG